jgi:hypothetical protein
MPVKVGRQVLEPARERSTFVQRVSRCQQMPVAPCPTTSSLRSEIGLQLPLSPSATFCVPPADDSTSWGSPVRRLARQLRASARHGRAALSGLERKTRVTTTEPQPPQSCGNQRRGWDLNPRDACAPSGFQDRPIRPLSHPAGRQVYWRCRGLRPRVDRAGQNRLGASLSSGDHRSARRRRSARCALAHFLLPAAS